MCRYIYIYMKIVNKNIVHVKFKIFFALVRWIKSVNLEIYCLLSFPLFIVCLDYKYCVIVHILTDHYKMKHIG